LSGAGHTEVISQPCYMAFMEPRFY
jgi:hypothetical protein